MMNNHNRALPLLRRHKFILFIVAYNSENYIRQVINRIPKDIVEEFAQIFLSDDCSSDRTFEEAVSAAQEMGLSNFRAVKQPVNLGYGGNQKKGFQYAIDKGFDYIVLLHGDGQYPPEFLPQIIEGFEDESIAAVFGSRMINKRQALKSGMPLYKWLGNQILTFVQNKILGSHLSEFHSGYRAYSIRALKSLPFLKNTDYFHFDTEIIIQLLANNFKIKEISVPVVYYKGQKSHVNSLKYALNCIKSVIYFRLYRAG